MKTAPRKALSFFITALLLSFTTAAGLNIILTSVIFPLVKMYPQIRGVAFFALFLHSLPWLVDILGALIISWIGYIFMPKRIWLFSGLLLLALCVAWPDGSYVLSATQGWGPVLLFTLIFWLGVLKAGLIMFNLVLWIHAVTFFLLAIFAYCLFNTKHQVSIKKF